MKVEQIMTTDVRTCDLKTNLAEAAIQMWDGDCGIIPVVDANNQVIGLITDRDICIATATKNRPAADITVGEIISEKAIACRPADDIKDALNLMGGEKLRRLPVVDEGGRLRGILSLADIAPYAERSEQAEITCVDLADALKAICSREVQVPEQLPKQSDRSTVAKTVL